MKYCNCVVLAASLMIPSLSSAGTVQVFTSLDAFTSVVGPTVLEDFGDEAIWPNEFSVLNSYTNVPEFGILPGDIASGVTFSAGDPNQSPLGLFKNFEAFFEGDELWTRYPLAIDFDVPQGAFGFITKTSFVPNGVRILFADGSSIVVGNFTVDYYEENFISDYELFVGFASKSRDIVGMRSIGRIIMDDFRFTTATVPVPAAGVLLAFALAGLGLLRARRPRT